MASCRGHRKLGHGMGFWGEGWGLISALVALTYGLQAVQIFLLPVPSSFSTWSLLTRRQPEASAESGALSLCRLTLLAFCVIGAGLVAMLPLAVCLAPGLFYPAILPLFAPCSALNIIGCLLLFLGSGMSLAAVLTLRSRAVFDASGETEILITNGIFQLCRHPVLIGLGLIYLGFVLLLPSVVLLGGLLLFLVNARSRMEFEEAELGRRFGAVYQTYVARVGRLGPRSNKRHY